MSKLIFYRQKRLDGGIRTGVELDGETILEAFDPGEEERNPSLLWYVDFRADGPGIPADPAEAPPWLIRNAPTIKQGLSGFADQLRKAGSDADDSPLQWDGLSGSGIDARMKIVCSASRREEARDLASILDDIRDHWEERIEALIAEFAVSPSGN